MVDGLLSFASKPGGFEGSHLVAMAVGDAHLHPLALCQLIDHHFQLPNLNVFSHFLAISSEAFGHFSFLLGHDVKI